MAEAVLPPLTHDLTLTEDGVMVENLIPTETEHAPFSSMQRDVAEMHVDLRKNVEEQGNGAEHLCSSTSFSKVEEYLLAAATLNSVEECWLKDNVEAFLSDSECSDVDLGNDGWVESEDLNSDSSTERIENRKKSKWLRPFFDMLNDIDPTAENTQDTLFYCPACRGSGLGEISVYKGFKPLIAHAKQYKKRRVKLHREFAAILEEDLKGCGIVTAEPCRVNPFCKEMGLIEDKKLTSLLIVWPPMVLIQSTGVEVDGHQKRVGLKRREILDMFKEYHPRKVTQVYDHEGNRIFLSLLMFDDSPVGYMHAKRLVKNFKCSKRGRMDWDALGHQKLQLCSDGMLYGYMAKEEDMFMFNTSDDARKKKVKWDVKRYQEVVMEPLIQMHEAKLENNWLKAKLREEEEHNRDLEKVVSKLYGKLELEEDEVHLTSQIATKQLEAKVKEMSETLPMVDDGWT